MSQRQLYQFSDLCHLLPAPTNVVIPNLIQIPFLILAIERLAFAVYDSILSDDTIIWWVEFDNFELDLPHTTPNCEEVAHTHRSVGFKEVWLQIDIKKRTSKALNSIRNRENRDAFRL